MSFSNFIDPIIFHSFNYNSVKIKDTNDFIKHISSKRFYIPYAKTQCGSHLRDLKESAIEEGDVL